MSMISEQVKELRYKADIYNTIGSAWELNRAEAKRLQEMLRQAADTIESISAKLQEANMERTAEDCGGWILCKERLPEDRQSVIVSRNGEVLKNVYEFHVPDEEDYEGECGDTVMGYFFSEYDAVVGVYSDDTISIAWQPLPEPKP